MRDKLSQEFFSRSADIVAREILGKILVRKEKKKHLKAKIVEVEAYLDEKDPASWARFGKRKDNLHMWSEAGTLLIKNVHKHNMLNFVTGKKGRAGAILIRALEPLNFEGRCSGPGLLTNSLRIGKELNGKILPEGDIWVENSKEFIEIESSQRVGVKNDLNKKMRFYIKGNKFVSKK